MANYEDKCVCQFRNATALHFHGCSLHRICIRDTEYVPQPVARRLYTITGWRRRAKREVAKSFCDLEARPERIVCQAVVDEMCQCAFPLTKTMIPHLVFFTHHGWSSVAPFIRFLTSKKSRNVRPWSGCRWLNGTNALWPCLFLQASYSFSASPSSLVTKKAATMAGDKRLRQNGMIIALTLYDMK